MSNKEIGELVGGVTAGYISRLINGQVHAGSLLAEKMSKLFRTEKDLWIIGTKEDRQAAANELRKEFNASMEARRRTVVEGFKYRLD